MESACPARTIQRVRENPSIGKGVAFCDRAMVLSPKRPDADQALHGLHHFTNNVEALRNLSRRLKEVEVDTSDAVRNSVDSFAGKNDEQTREEVRNNLKRHASLVTTLRKDLKGVEDTRRSMRTVTFAVAATQLIREKETLDLLGEPFNTG